MLTDRIIPCLDIRDGRVVKGVRFAGLRDAGDPVAQAIRYEEDGADEIVMLDVSATNEGRSAAIDVVRAVRANLSIALAVGGGVRSVEDAVALLEAGADKVCLNTAAVEDPSILGLLASRVGRQCVVLSVDAARTGQGWAMVTHAGRRRRGIDAVAWAAEATGLGAGEILLTSWDRDGTRSGYDLELIRAVRDVVDTPIIASGGADSAQDMAEALAAGADAVLAASILHDQVTTIADIKARLDRIGLEVRR